FCRAEATTPQVRRANSGYHERGLLTRSMTMAPWNRCLALLAVGLACVSAEPSAAQTARTLKIVVPLAAGGGADIVARVLAEQIGRAQNVNAVVENRPGAGTVIGTEAVARAAPDGETV